jgi:hypothetical protein
MSDPIPDGFAYHVVAPEAHAGLTCRFLKPAEFQLADLPPETPDFSEGAKFMPLAVAMTQYGPMVFSLAARPAFDDGAVSQWLEYICSQEGYPHSPVTTTRLGNLPAVACDATQKADDGTPMKMRFVLLEDGGRLFQMAAMAPEAFWSAALKKMAPMIESFELREVRGTKVPLLPGDPPPQPLATEPPPAASETPSAATDSPATSQETSTPAATEEPSPFLKPEELLALALADDTGSLDPELPFNANLRDRGAGLVPRVAGTDPATKSVRIAAGAAEGFFRVPFGWHVIDDGRRTLVFDAGGRIQVNLTLRRHEGAATTDFAAQLLQQYLEQQPGLPTIQRKLSDIAVSAVRGVVIGNETLDQYFLVRDVGRQEFYLVAKVSTAAEDCSRAMDLAGDILATFESPRA